MKKLTLFAVAVLVAVAALAAAPAQEALAASGYLCYGEDVDVWWFRGNVIDYVGDRITITVDPDWGLDVGIGLYVVYYDFLGNLRARLLRYTNWRGKGGTERISYYVSSSNFNFTELTFGRLAVGVHRIRGCDGYWIGASRS